MVRLKDMRDQIKKRIDSETKRIVTSIRRDYDAAVKRESYVRAAFEKQKNEALDLNSRSVQYEILKREADTDRELYNGLLQRLKETGISANLASSNIQILDRAEKPKSPFKPNKKSNITLALAIGLFGGIGLAFFAEYLDNTVKSAEDIEKRICLPSLGLVPVHHEKGKNMPVESVAHFDGNCPVSEAFSSIRTLLLFSTAGRPPKVMMVTSPRSGEGKTTTLLNTAISLTRSGGRVIVVDADMRRPRLHKILKVDNSVGLSSFLSGNAELGRDLIKKTEIPGIDVLPSGPIPPNASQLLGSYRLRELIEGLYPLYSFILFDTAPMIGLSDAAITSTQTDGVILVVRYGQTPREAAQQAGKILAGLNARVLGVVLNAMNETTLKYSYHYQYYYQPDKSNDKR
jgi:polysaccharide biosynthesis transport protein